MRVFVNPTSVQIRIPELMRVDEDKLSDWRCRVLNKRQVCVSSPAQCLSDQLGAFAAFAIVYPIDSRRVAVFAVLIDEPAVELVAVQFAVLIPDDVDKYGTIVSEVFPCFIDAVSDDLGPLRIVFIVM